LYQTCTKSAFDVTTRKKGCELTLVTNHSPEKTYCRLHEAGNKGLAGLALCGALTVLCFALWKGAGLEFCRQGGIVSFLAGILCAGFAFCAETCKKWVESDGRENEDFRATVERRRFERRAAEAGRRKAVTRFFTGSARERAVARVRCRAVDSALTNYHVRDNGRARHRAARPAFALAVSSGGGDSGGDGSTGPSSDSDSGDSDRGDPPGPSLHATSFQTVGQKLNRLSALAFSAILVDCWLVLGRARLEGVIRFGRFLSERR
jgi:hypothetical protein